MGRDAAMTELEQLDFKIHSTEIKLWNARDYYQYSTMCGSIENRVDAMVRCRQLESQLAELRRQRALMTGGDKS